MITTIHTAITRAASLPADRRERTAHLVRLAGLAIVIVAVLARGLANLTGYYLIDDYIFIGRAASEPLLSTENLLGIHLGHLMPAAFAVNWAVVQAAPFGYWLPALLMAIAWGGCLLLMRQVLQEWLGPRPAILVALAFYAITPLTLQASGWWASALNALPLQLLGLVAIRALLRRERSADRGHRRRQGLVIVLAILAALAFFEKAVLVPALIVALAIAWSPVAPWWRALAAWVRGAPWLTAALAVITIGYLGAYAAVALVGTPAPERSLAGILDGLWIALTGNLMPTTAGGPIAFGSGELFLIETPPTWLAPVAAVIVLGLGATAVALGGTALRLGVVTAGYAFGAALTVTVGRSDWTDLVLRAIRYFADAAVPLTLLIAAVAVGILDARRDWRGRVVVAAIAGPVMGIVLVLSLISTVNFYGQSADRSARAAFGNALDSLAEAPRESAIMDQFVPSDIVSPLQGARYALTSALFGLVEDRPPIAEQTDRLRIWSADGYLVEATVEGPGSLGPPPEPCGWPIGSTTTIPLAAEIVYFGHVIAITASAARSTELTVTLGDGPEEAWSIPAGTSVQYRAQMGGGSADITLSSADPGLCVSDVVVGAAIPVDRS